MKSAINSVLKARGSLSIVKRNEHGEIVDRRDINNLVVTVGKAFITSRMIGVASDAVSHMAVGTGNTAAAAGDTTLETELNRQALDSAVQSTTTTTDDTVTYERTFAAGEGTGALTEAGLLNAASAGTLLARTVFPVVNKGAADSITITWKITIT